MCSIDVKGGEIEGLKKAVNKGFPDIETISPVDLPEVNMSGNPYFYRLREHVNYHESDRVELTD